MSSSAEFNLNESDYLLDIATGTGDVVFSMYKRFKNRLVGLDIADKMISIAKSKQFKKGLIVLYHTF